MGKYIPSTYLSLILDKIRESTHVAVCSQQPTNFYHGWWATIRYNTTVYAVGSIVRPSTTNGFIYECSVGGTSGAVEPVWPTVEDGTVVDGDVTWVAKTNYCLVLSEIFEQDWATDVQAAATVLTFLGKPRVTAHAAGTVGHTALVCLTDKTLRYVTTSSTAKIEDNEIEVGRVTNINSFFIEQSNLL